MPLFLFWHVDVIKYIQIQVFYFLEYSMGGNSTGRYIRMSDEYLQDQNIYGLLKKEGHRVLSMYVANV